MKRLAIFDLDDTLLDTSHVYWEARSTFIESLGRTGFDKDEVLATFERNDSLNIVKYGFIPERYAKTMEETYSELCAKMGRDSQDSVLSEIHAAGKIVKDKLPELISGAVDLLEGARRLGFTMLLLTRGVEEVQRRKIAFHKLDQYFDRVEIVARKDALLIQQLISEMDVSPDDCWIVGDSVKSDINPGSEAGAHCILFLYTHHSYYWQQEYGEQPAGLFFIAHDLPEALEILRNPAVVAKVSMVPPRDSSLPI